MWQPQPQTNRPKMSVARIAREKKMKPALTAPCWSVCMLSEGSIGETVRPAIHHWITCAIMNRFNKPSARARHRLVFDLRICVPGIAEVPRAPGGGKLAKFGSVVSQPDFKIFCFPFERVPDN